MKQYKQKAIEHTNNTLKSHYSFYMWCINAKHQILFFLQNMRIVFLIAFCKAFRCNQLQR